MAKWFFEPGHTAAEFCVRHMMVTWVRGHFKEVHGSLEWDPEERSRLAVEVEIPTARIWTGVEERDNHLKSADFFDVENHPRITFRGSESELIGENDWRVMGDLTIRGVTRQMSLDVRYLGRWQTPYWVGGETKRTFIRAGAVATGRLNRFDFGVAWQDRLERGGLVVGKDVFVTIDAEALLEVT